MIRLPDPLVCCLLRRTARHNVSSRLDLTHERDPYLYESEQRVVQALCTSEQGNMKYDR